MLEQAQIIVWNDTDGITQWTRGAELLYGWSKSEAVGKKPFELLKTMTPRPVEDIMSDVVSDQRWEGELLNTRKDGHQITVASCWALNRDRAGRTTIIESDSDITRLKVYELALSRDKDAFEKMVADKTRELVSTQMELERTRRLSDIGTLAATVAHELRNPLGVIRTAVYNIKRKAHNPLLDGHIGNIEKKILEGDQIINNLLGYSRIRTPQYEKIKLYDVLDECVNIARERFEKKHILFIKDAESIREQFMDGDHFQLREVLNNILDNAGQAVEAGKGVIKVSAHTDTAGCMILTITDNGSGIDGADIGRLFEPFFTRKSKGTGLGLTVCKEMISLHHGDIRIGSEPSKGTTVTITLPLERAT